QMSLEANFKAMAITGALRDEQIPGVVDICPSNASYLVRLNPDRVHPTDLLNELKRLEGTAGELPDDYVVSTRIVDVPVLFNDEWTHETLMRFRDRHQDSTRTDLEYAAQLNGFRDVSALID